MSVDHSYERVVTANLSWFPSKTCHRMLILPRSDSCAMLAMHSSDIYLAAHMAAITPFDLQELSVKDIRLKYCSMQTSSSSSIGPPRPVDLSSKLERTDSTWRLSISSRSSQFLVSMFNSVRTVFKVSNTLSETKNCDPEIQLLVISHSRRVRSLMAVPKPLGVA